MLTFPKVFRYYNWCLYRIRLAGVVVGFYVCVTMCRVVTPSYNLVTDSHQSGVLLFFVQAGPNRYSEWLWRVRFFRLRSVPIEWFSNPVPSTTVTKEFHLFFYRHFSKLYGFKLHYIFLRQLHFYSNFYVDKSTWIVKIFSCQIGVHNSNNQKIKNISNSLFVLFLYFNIWI